MKKIFSFLFHTLKIKRVDPENIFFRKYLSTMHFCWLSRRDKITTHLSSSQFQKSPVASESIISFTYKAAGSHEEKVKRRILACRNITTVSGTKGDGEVRVLNSHEWHEMVYARGIPSVSSFFFRLLSFYCEGALGRPGEEREQGGTTGWERTEGGRCTQWAFFWKIKVQRRHRVAELCRAAARVKIKIARKNVGRAKCERWREGEEWAGGRGGWECWLVI